MVHKNGKTGVMVLLFLCLFSTACGSRPVTDTAAETGTEDESGTLPALEEAEKQSEVVAAGQESPDVVTAYTTEEPTDSGQEIPTQYTDDLSLLDLMGQTDNSYAYRDGMVYYRQYHKDSFEEGALWANYQPMAGTDKEIVCIDRDGKRTELFSDRGYGGIYLIGERFYMTERQDYTNVYSVDMQGENRIDYGHGEICAVDMDRTVIVLKMQGEETWDASYCVLDCMGGEMRQLLYDSCFAVTFWAYDDGWCYFETHQEDDRSICRVIAVSLEGERKEIIALTSDVPQGDGYSEHVCRLEVAGDRIFLAYGGYAGSGNFYQGGRIITVKLDGSDYRAVASYADHYLICHDEGRPLVYFPHYPVVDGGEDYPTTVWDVETNTIYQSDISEQLIYEQQIHDVLPYQNHSAPKPLCVLNEEATDVYALPDDSGRIVRVATHLDDYITKRGEGEADYVVYRNLYYADGFLYFSVEFNVYDREYSIGWRDGYHRFQTDVYRMELAGNAVELLYSY